MFGLPSIGKLMVLAAILGAVWYGFKFIGRMQQARDEQERQKAAAAKSAGQQPVDKSSSGAVELVQCPTCDAYIPADSGCNCGRQG